MGKSLKYIHDPALCKPHKKGEPVMLVQPALHERYGSIFIAKARFWIFHFNQAINSFNALMKLQESEILLLPIHDSNSRIVYNEKLLHKIYTHGTSLAINTKLTVNHFLLEVETKSKTNLGVEIDQRLNATYKLLKCPELVKHNGHSAYHEIESIRNAVEHPTPNNTYNNGSSDWATVPMAWFVGERPEKTFAAFDEYMRTLSNKWDIVAKQYEKPGSIPVKRGLQSIHQFQKAPKA